MYAARKKFRDLKHAADVFASNYKRLVVQRYAKKYRAAVAIVRKFIIGFMNRNKPKCAENIYVSVSDETENVLLCLRVASCDSSVGIHCTLTDISNFISSAVHKVLATYTVPLNHLYASVHSCLSSSIL